MLLFNPSLGQITDRLHILSLKIDAFRRAERNASALVNERNRCYDRIRDITAKLISYQYLEYHRLSSELFKQNLRQWDAEDELRKLLPTLDDVPSYGVLLLIAELAKKTHHGNENRNRLVAEIDDLVGEVPERKIYS
jgi:hypothetical protein